MKNDRQDRGGLQIVTWLTGMSGWSFYCAVISLFGVTGYSADFLRSHAPDWIVVGLLIAPVVIILFIPWGEFPDRVVATAHIVAASLFMAYALAMEVGIHFGYRPPGSNFYRVLAHLGWTFAWAGVLRRARAVSERSYEPYEEEQHADEYDEGGWE